MPTVYTYKTYNTSYSRPNFSKLTGIYELEMSLEVYKDYFAEYRAVTEDR
jgi:hypothetical protein